MYINPLPVICLMGATAVGKSQLAIDLAQILPCDIISVDSVMVYRGMDIGTAKPDPETLSRIPHHLVNIRDPIHPYSAGDFFRDVQKVIQNSFDNQRIPLLVGGTMLYFNTLRQGLADLPHYGEHPGYFKLKAQLDSMDLETLYKTLQACDSCTAKRLHVHDRQRVERALLVYYLSKKPLSELYHSHQRRLPYSIIWIAVQPESREKLKENIDIRFKQMLSQGFIEEVESLYHQPGFSSALPAYRAVGYRQVIDYLKREIDLDTLKIRGTIATCQLAKRQLTWLRSWTEATIFKANDINLLKNTKEYIESQLSA